MGFFSFCMKLFPPLQVYVPIVVLNLNFKMLCDAELNLVLREYEFGETATFG